MEHKQKDLVKGLNEYLADLAAWYVKWHNLHWNVKGRQFFGLHEKLETLYEGVADELDAVAERILMLGGRPAASMSEYLRITSVKELDSAPIDGDKVARNLLSDAQHREKKLNQLIDLASEVADPVTEGMLADALGETQKLRWMLNAWLAD